MQPNPPTITLSPRETEVIALLAKGMRYKQIGEELGVKRRTAAQYANSAREKLGANSIPEAIATAVHLGLIHFDDQEQSEQETPA